MLRWSHDHHRDVRGGLDAATSSHRVRDRHQGRHVMTPIPSRSPDNAPGLCSGRCPATTMLGLSLYQTHATDLEKPQNPAFSTLVWQIIAPTSLIRGVNPCCIGPLLHAQ